MDVHTITVPYIPNSDSEALLWLENFHNRLALHPKAFGVDPRDVETLGKRIHQFRTWLALADSPDARAAAKGAAVAGAEGRGAEGGGAEGGGAGATAEKIMARNAAVATVQLLVRIIEANALTTAADRVRLGLPPSTRK